MEKTRRETLNEIYSPLCERMRALSAALAERGLPAESGWFSGHYSKDETGQYRMDDFPIPYDLAGGCGHSLQSLDGFLRFAFLIHPKDGVDQHHNQDDRHLA